MRIFRQVCRFLAALEIMALKLVRWLRPPRYTLLGNCVKCGKCCQEIIFNPPRFVRRSFLLRLFLAYHKVMHNFAVVARGPSEEIIFSCGHLQSDGRCGIHKWRPFLCRNFPVVPWFEPPSILPYCSYRVAARPVTRMQQRASLPILNPQTAVHHPSPDPSTPLPEHFQQVDLGP